MGLSWGGGGGWEEKAIILFVFFQMGNGLGLNIFPFADLKCRFASRFFLPENDSKLFLIFGSSMEKKFKSKDKSEVVIGWW